MTKTLSEQLCEIVGLEIPGKLVFRKRNWDKKTYINSGHGYKEFDFKSQPDAYVDIIPTRNWDEKNGFSFPYSATRIDFLQCLYLRLATNAYSDIDQIKQSIRDYDGWVWG